MVFAAAALSASAETTLPQVLWAGAQTGVAGGDIVGNMVIDPAGNLVTLSYVASNATTGTMTWMGNTVEGVNFSTAYDGSSTNKNAVITCQDPETGAYGWVAYSYSGDWINGNGQVTACADGGYVYATKVRVATTGTVTDATQKPVFVSANGTQTVIDGVTWHYDGHRIYNMVVVKLDKDGNLQWYRASQVDGTPMADATSTACKAATTDGIEVTAVTTDAAGNIYVSGRVSTTVKFSDTVTFASTCSSGWNGDSQTTRGSMFVAKYTADGTFAGYFTPTGAIEAEKVFSLDCNGSELIVSGYLKASAADTPLDFGGKSVSVNKLQTLFLASISTDLAVNWVTVSDGTGYNGSSQTFQNVAVSFIDSNIYLTAQWTGSITFAGATVTTSSTMREGLLLQYAYDGTPVKGISERAVISQAGIDGYFASFASPVSVDSIWVVGSNMTSKNLYVHSYAKSDLSTNGVATNLMTTTGVVATGGGTAADGVVYCWFRPNKEATVLGSTTVSGFSGYTDVIAAIRFAEAAPADPTVWDGVTPEANADYAFSGGDGTEATPYIIATAADLAQLNANVAAGTTYEGKYFIQTADLTLNTADTGYDWPGVSGAKYFMANYDGQGHVIDRPCFLTRYTYAGIFPFCRAATINDVHVTNAYANVDVDNVMEALGVIAGDAQATTFSNCSTTGDLTINISANKSAYLGGIIGMGAVYSGKGNTIVNCYSNADIHATVSEGVTPLMFYAAGISAQHNGTIENCYYGGTMTYNYTPAAKVYCSAICGNPNGTNSATAAYYRLGAGSSSGIYGYSNADTFTGTTDASDMTLDDIATALNNRLEAIYDAGRAYLLTWKNDGTNLAFGSVFDRSQVIDVIFDTPTAVPDGVYNLMGIRVADRPEGLPSGLYIYGGRKLLVR